MGVVQNCDNDRGVELGGDIEAHINTALTEGRTGLENDEAALGPIYRRTPFTVDFIVEGGAVETIDEGDVIDPDGFRDTLKGIEGIQATISDDRMIGDRKNNDY